MEERRKKGLCFNCDEKFVRGHQCKKLFWIDLEEPIEEGIDNSDFALDKPEISLNAITGTQNPQSMRLMGCWQGGDVLILVDSSSTHSFVSADKLAELGATVTKQGGLKVNVANGDQLCSPGICKGTPILLVTSHFHSFSVDLFILPLTGFDIVLGVNWLRTLAPILWDFALMKMCFNQQGSLVELQGMVSTDYTKQSDYGIIVAPLTAMLRKNNFRWTDEAVDAFKKLKSAMTSTPILVLPDSELPFVIEWDASGSGIGAVLLQQNMPVAFFSRSLAIRHQSLPEYERELIGLVKAIKHWHSYLWGREFVVRTDHYTLKYLLEQRHLSSTHQLWVSKLLGFCFTVEYKSGKANTVADALSRCDSNQSSLLAISMPHLSLFDDIQKEQLASDELFWITESVKRGIPEILVHWSHSSPADASWEQVHSITDKFPEFQLEDKLSLGMGSNVTKPLQVYTRYGHGSKAIQSKQPLIELLN
ncbi:hypothetical protein K2173_020525 [Erythroxylum novogranatense]|uniref:Reverse transcriptase/retrotransposon-derived protein RNase H-like domain-containing protein n=1 Tax=Erythroxylum novogranatense TaxID=1862640 RepID=A0AAV8TIP1_9ROSI|nr:hypothetical protein K2173_020525 [Erythroxylum novogranatense]